MLLKSKSLRRGHSVLFFLLNSTLGSLILLFAFSLPSFPTSVMCSSFDFFDFSDFSDSSLLPFFGLSLSCPVRSHDSLLPFWALLGSALKLPVHGLHVWCSCS